MKNACCFLGALFLGCILAGLTNAQQRKENSEVSAITSAYTDITQHGCKTIEVDKESGSSVQSCSGVGGYKLLVEDSDNRMSVTVIDPGGRKHALNYWSIITPNFSSLGTKAEWRVAKKGRRIVPIALIVRVNANENIDTNKVSSYLVVTKITAEKICVTDKIGATSMANREAREAADSSAPRTCLEK